MPLWLLFLTLSSIIINIFTVMLFVFVLGINQYYLPLFCITMQKKKEKKKAGFFTGHFDCLWASRASSITTSGLFKDLISDLMAMRQTFALVSLVVCRFYLGLWNPCTLNCQVVSLTRISYIHGYMGRLLRNWTTTTTTETICTCVKGQLDGGLSWEGKDWVDYFNMTILYLSNPSPRGHKD